MMKETMVVIVAAFLMSACAEAGNASTGAAPAQVQQKHQKQRAQILGQGTSAISAISDARSSASKVAGSYSFTTVSQRTTGKDKDWTCILIIEWEVK